MCAPPGVANDLSLDQQSNFRFLPQNSPLLAELAVMDERLFPFDAAIAVLKLCLLAEAIA